MKIKAVTSYLEHIAPLSLQEEYDNSGLITGNENDSITGVLICIDCIEDVVEEAIQKKCNLIIAHHPIVFRGLKQITGKTYIERVIIKAIQNNIAIYAIHTNLDNVSLGVNKRICDKLGLNKCAILSEKNYFGITEMKKAAFGSGMIGVLKKPLSEKDFFALVKNRMQVKVIRHTSFLGKKIHKVAVCGGSGSFLLEHAIRAGADAFVSADFKYHQFFDADNQLVIVDIGHYESEQFTKELIHDLLKEKFSIFALLLSEVNTNPVKYL